MSPHPVLPVPTTDVSSQELGKALENARENSFELYYFDVISHGATSRALLAYADANWKSTKPTPGAWMSYAKPLTKFGSLPILYETHTSPSGKKVIIEHADSLAIELRVAKAFDLLGDNAYEESQILGFFSNTRSLRHSHEDAYFAKVEDLDKERDLFINVKLAQWIQRHELELGKNKDPKTGQVRGYYIGNRVSLADIKTAVAIDEFLNEQYAFRGGFDRIKNEGLISPERTPNLWKVRENVWAKKSYKDYLDSPFYKVLLAVNTAYFEEEYKGPK
ncbi:hypothetical protein BGZ83_008932 [Gryganskiella cystojenkinii]|nr:hypothetical protein BGZ83_008932 [Gryganskiella cystojenkinii]